MTSFASRIVYTHHGHGGICWTGIVSSCQQFEKVIFQGVQQRVTLKGGYRWKFQPVSYTERMVFDAERVFGVTSLRPGMASGSRIHTEAWHFMPNPGKKQVQPRWSQSNGAKCALIAVNPQPSSSRDHTRQLPRLVVIE